MKAERFQDRTGGDAFVTIGTGEFSRNFAPGKEGSRGELEEKAWLRDFFK